MIAPRRPYASKQREDAAAATRARVLTEAKALFEAKGIDAVTIAAIAGAAGVSASTVYGLFKSKEGVLQALMEAALFGDLYRSVLARFDTSADAVEQIAVTAAIARAIYEREAAELGPLRGVSAFSPALRALEQGLEDRRYALQEARIARLFAEGKARAGLSQTEARRVLWMYTSRDLYRMLVQDSGWSQDRYQAWLSQTLIEALVDPAALAKSR